MISTLSQLRNALAPHGVSVQRVDGFIRISLDNNSDAPALHFDDLQDAYEAGVQMAQEQQPVNEELEYAIRAAERMVNEARDAYISACEWLARDLTRAAENAKEGRYVSETIMSTSNVSTITAVAARFNTATETLTTLRNLKAFAAKAHNDIIA